MYINSYPILISCPLNGIQALDLSRLHLCRVKWSRDTHAASVDWLFLTRCGQSGTLQGGQMRTDRETSGGTVVKPYRGTDVEPQVGQM